MATDGGANSGSDFSRMSLEEFTRQVPPGWRPGLRSYTFRQYIQKLRLWWRFAEIQERQAGPLIAARLGGLAFKKAMSLRLLRQETPGAAAQLYTGEQALGLDRQESQDDGYGNIIVPEDKSGAAHLLDLLRVSFEQHDQDGMVEALDKFFDHRRGPL